MQMDIHTKTYTLWRSFSKKKFQTLENFHIFGNNLSKKFNLSKEAVTGIKM